MCGRYRRTTSEEELARLYHIPIPPQRDLPISWNIAPSQDMLVIRYNPKAKQRSLDTLRWGLIPYWAKDPKIAFKTINARAETVDSAPSYREAFKKRRCLIPADGFYEWRTIGGAKIPFAIGMKDDRPFAFAGLLLPRHARPVLSFSYLLRVDQRNQRARQTNTGHRSSDYRHHRTRVAGHLAGGDHPADLVQSLNLGPIWQASDSLSPRAPGSASPTFF